MPQRTKSWRASGQAMAPAELAAWARGAGRRPAARAPPPPRRTGRSWRPVKARSSAEPPSATARWVQRPRPAGGLGGHGRRPAPRPRRARPPPGACRCPPSRGRRGRGRRRGRPRPASAASPSGVHTVGVSRRPPDRRRRRAAARRGAGSARRCPPRAAHPLVDQGHGQPVAPPARAARATATAPWP